MNSDSIMPVFLVYRSFQNFISNADPDTLAALSSGKSEEVPADMVKTASNMIGKMSPEELKRMIELASSFEGDNPFLKGGSPNLSPDMLKSASDMMSKMPPEELQKMFEMVSSKGKDLSSPAASNLGSFNSGSLPPNMSPDILKTASDMMSKMPPEELQKMFEMASSMTGKDSSSTSASVNANRRSSTMYSESRECSAVNVTHHEGETSSHEILPNLRNAPQSSFPASAVDFQEQMRNQMKDPAMRQVCSICALCMSFPFKVKYFHVLLIYCFSNISMLLEMGHIQKLPLENYNLKI